jgi:tRNA (guanine-N7-)-methyltransferase
VETRQLKVDAPELRLEPERAIERLDWREVFGSDGPVEVEIGIGKGRFLLSVAAARPDVSHLGVEWSNEYLRIAETRAARRGLTNVRFVRADARRLVHDAIPTASVSAYYVFYPDPWPKKRHQKRRFLQTATVEHLVRTLRPGGTLHVSTDHREYWEVIEEAIAAHPALERLREFGGPGFPLPVDAPLTNFEAKYEDQGRSRFRASWRRGQP